MAMLSARTTQSGGDAGRANLVDLDLREAADGLRDLLVRTNRLIGFFPCECGRADCALTVPLTVPEYDAIRPHPIEARAHAR